MHSRCLPRGRAEACFKSFCHLPFFPSLRSLSHTQSPSHSISLLSQKNQQHSILTLRAFSPNKLSYKVALGSRCTFRFVTFDLPLSLSLYQTLCGSLFPTLLFNIPCHRPHFSLPSKELAFNILLSHLLVIWPIECLLFEFCIIFAADLGATTL